MKYEGAPRYALILETDSSDKYYYNAKIGNFIRFDSYDEVGKTSLNALDFLTANYSDVYDLANSFGIGEGISKVYLTYQFKGEKRIKAVFNNPTWAHIALTYNGKSIDFKDKENLSAFTDTYNEITDLGSGFADILLKNYKRLISLSPKTQSTIRFLVAHENAIKRKKEYFFPSYEYSDRDNRVMKIYDDDRYGFYSDLKKRLSNYREFRTVYLNYCKYKNIVSVNENFELEEKPKKKALIPPQQISMFDND